MADTYTSNDHFRINMTQEEFGILSDFIYNDLGIKMPEVKRIMLQSRLQKRLSELKLPTFKAYIDYVFSKEGQDEELIKMIDLVTTNKTDFFREPQHFDFMNQVALPHIINESSNKKMIKIWSAGCSSGEEPYTIAIVMKEFLQFHPEIDFEIFATDLSMRILQKAILAIYHEDRVSVIPYDLKRKYFLKSKDAAKKTFRVIPDLRSKVSFQRQNFMDNYYAVDKEFDIIFCRNVLIYFDRDTQQSVITKLSLKLRTGGYFFLGHSESITNMQVPLKQIKPAVFVKI